MPPEEVEAWAQRMWRQREELSDLDADALDILSALWLYQARTPTMTLSPMSSISWPCADCKPSGVARVAGVATNRNSVWQCSRPCRTFRTSGSL